jgi:hypothetical protein
MQAQMWSFVVARNRSLDWRPIVVPDVLASAGAGFSLVLETMGQHPLSATCRTWCDNNQKAWTITYRSLAATESFVGNAGNAQLLDRFGRPVFLIEGVLVEAETSIPPASSNRFIERCHVSALSAFCRFWPEERENAEPELSTSRDLDWVEQSAIEDCPPEDVRSSSRRRLLLGLLIGSAVAAAVVRLGLAK